MSSDVMIVCKEDDSHFDGENDNKAFFIDEASMGDSHTDFGKWFVDRFCGAPTIIQQLQGSKKHKYTEIKSVDIEEVKKQLEIQDKHKDLNSKRLLNYMEEHQTKHISTENW